MAFYGFVHESCADISFSLVKELVNIQRDVPLAPLTTFKIGGKARFFINAGTEGEVAEGLGFALREGLDLFILGGGSNVLVSDAGFNGLVLKIALRGISGIDENAGTVNITAQAGEDWDNFVSQCVDRDLAGIECLSGIPGLVGGTPVQNVGAYGQEVSDTIKSVRCIDRMNGDIATLSNAECGFSYRTSIFNSTARERYVVLGVTFALRAGGKPKLAYKDLIEHFDESRRPSLCDVREVVLAIRRSKSMVIDPADPNAQCAGSYFKNPVMERNEFEKMQRHFDDLPHFDFGDKVKVPAAWLIARAGFGKGFSAGNAGISTNHNLALINRGGATADEIIALEQTIREAVKTRFGISLIREPERVGF